MTERVKVIIDRPMGSKHPKHQFIYPINYGYLPNTVGGDGEEIDVYVVGEFEPLSEFEGYLIAKITRENDNEDKYVACAQYNRYTLKQIQALVEFQERFFITQFEMIEE